jgi:hypothetical protein
MRYLEKFANYLNEASEEITDLSKEELDELLIPIKDLGVEYSFNAPIVITDGEFAGYKSMNIKFINSFKLGTSGGYKEQIIDDKFWDFLDELISFKNRLESDRVSISTNWRDYIVVTFIQKAKVEGDLFTIQKLYNDMSLITNDSKSNFTNNMTKSLDKENLKITVNCNTLGSYTDRKWNGLFGGIDFSKFNVEKEINEDRWGSNSVVVTITLKSEP